MISCGGAGEGSVFGLIQFMTWVCNVHVVYYTHITVYINRCLYLGTTTTFIMVTVCLFLKKKENFTTFIGYRSKCKVYY